jgi:uncharacterized lipoprotein YddW (UPF0748 family)
MVRLNKSSQTKERNQILIFSVSPNHYEFAYKQQLQDWLGWVHKNIVDRLIVQVYRNRLDDFQSQSSLLSSSKIKSQRNRGCFVWASP